MSIKIYLPTEYFYLKRTCNLYGQLHISEDNVVVYYVMDVDSYKPDSDSNKMRFLGAILCNDSFADSSYCRSHDMILCFTYTKDSPNISLIFTGITPERLKPIKLILYDQEIVRSLVVKGQNTLNHWTREGHDECDFYMLAHLVQPKPDVCSNSAGLSFYGSRPLSLLANMPMQLLENIIGNTFVNSIITHTVIYRHYKEWQLIYANGSRLSNIIIDRALGIILMLTLFTLVSHPGDYLIQISHIIINQLYSLLKVLEGSPIGLKLNIHLNNFFLDCFKYHIELWSTFLDLIEPIVRQIFLAIGAFGCFGLTYQIALLADLISIVGLHAHCFYVYTKVLNNVELKGLSVLWQVVRGNRYNILRNRTEAHNYMNRQLYLATIFFSAILFLFPTTLVYYIVFATLKALTSATLAILDFIRRKLLNFPIDIFLKYFRKGFNEIDSLRVLDIPLQKQLVFTHRNSEILIFVYKLQV
ncbi:phosphatidylinositol N-acetylglucosaminyltransferase subunit Q [Drosophila grimshawi]|uniref:phosphatidylinositol N-acetylglucosaminyltransferase subunit Q n=1 Tax=Drosophila grimshawi TaxID=7222 RepID=UPI000C870E29|nr:phosphatidylinositol N-acetylglucosaminyltransferase subunit Q [Drosophila grimshawi]